jgi:hypothetical protein
LSFLLTHTGQVNCSDDISDERAALTFAVLAGFSALVFTGAASASVSESESTLSDELSDELSDKPLSKDPNDDSDPKLDSGVSEADSPEDDSVSHGNCAKTNVKAAAQIRAKRLLVKVFLSMALSFLLKYIK